MGNLKNALIAILVPLPSIVFYLSFLHHYKTSSSSNGVWAWCFHHPFLLASLLFFVNIDLLFWVISLLQSSHWMIDLYWTVLPVMLVNYYATHPLSNYNVFRSLIVIVLTCLWSIRLSHSYFRRERWQWGAREDWRFTTMREQYNKQWWWVSFFAVYIAQQLLMTGVTLPMYTINSVDKPFNTWDIIATIVCVMGIVIAYFADTQLHEFVRKNEELRKVGEVTMAVLDTGLWRYSRHPNYFGEQMWWWGLGVFGWNVGYGWSFVGAFVNSVCLAYVSGLVERRMLKNEYRAKAYREYQNATSVLIPWFNLSSHGGHKFKST